MADNPTIRHLASALRPPASGWPVSGRPVFNLSLALNYAVSGERTWTYHALSLAIHIAAGLALFGIVRRTAVGGARPLGAPAGLAVPPYPTFIAWAAALLWTLHPLQTESVTYISQRSESLMGMFYLLTLYSFIRYTECSRAGDGAGIVPPSYECGYVGPLFHFMLLSRHGHQEVMVTAPVMVFLYDPVFVSGSFAGAWRRHRRVYLGLAASWLLLAWLMAGSAGRGGTVGFDTKISWWAYGVTQFRAVAHYLRLCLWPRPLLFSYGLTLGGPIWEVIAEIVMLVLAAASLIAAVRGSWLGFLGAWFFIILCPTSSVVPVATELIAEHRAYLSLAAVAVLIAFGGCALLRRLALRLRWGAPILAAVAFAAVAVAATAEGIAHLSPQSCL